MTTATQLRAPASARPAGEIHAGVVVEARGLTKFYRRGGERVDALRDAEMTIPCGAFAVIAGPSGSGKSTLLHLLGGIERPSAGRVRVRGLELSDASEAELTAFRRQAVGFIFQFYNLLPSLDARDNVALPLLAQGLAWDDARRRAEAMLAAVGLGHRIRHKPAQLSGGEQQRVAIARATVVEPALVLADEPTGDLDSASAENVLDIMRDLNRRLGATFVLATHSPALQAGASHRYKIRDGRLRLLDRPG
jgi:ABC-type lipoprotein export system ATPase subunit